jgi:penicillin-binding protein 1A
MVSKAPARHFPQDIDTADVDKHCAKNLDLGQSAILAAVLNGPSYFSPYGAHQQELIDRQHIVLDLMVEQKYVTQAQADAAKWQLADLGLDSPKISHSQNLYANLDPSVAHYVLYAQDYLEAKYGNATVTEGGLKVMTAMDYDKQQAAYNAIQKNIGKIKAYGGSNSAMVVTDPKSGHLLAMIGSANFNDPKNGQVNVATSQRQPGSSFKPIVYSALFGKNKDVVCVKDCSCLIYGLGMVMYDVLIEFGTPTQSYRPSNFGNKINGVITVRKGLAGSLNIPAVKALAMTGVSSSIQTAQALGISTLGGENYGLSLVLGTGGVKLVQMANAYESFANGGLHYTQTPILKLYDQKGQIMEDNSKPAKPKQALDPQVASLTADVLADQSAKIFAFGNDLLLKNYCGNNNATNCVHYGVKTGTTEHFNDAWTMGFTTDLVAGVWVGNNDNRPMNSAAADIAAPVWRTFMDSVLGGKANSAFVKAPGLKTVTLDKTTGRAVTAGTKDKVTDVFPSWYVPMAATSGKSAAVDTISGKLATDCTPPLAKSTVYSSAILPEITKSENAFQYQNWLSALVKAGYSTTGGDLPTDSDTAHSCSDTKPTVNISDALGGGPYSFNVQVASGTFTANKLEVYFDDQVISTRLSMGQATIL